MAHKHMKNMPKSMKKDMPHYDKMGNVKKGGKGASKKGKK